MKTRAAVLLISIFPLLLSSCAKQIYQCKTEPSGTVSHSYSIDSMNYDPESKIMYVITNDHNNLYVHLRVSDEQIIRRILLGGLNIWLDTTGGQKENFGLRYPLIQPRELWNGGGFNVQGPNMGDSVVIDELTLTELLIMGLDGPGSENFSYTGNKSGITAELQLDEAKNMNYKATFPLRYLGKRNKLSIGVTFSQRQKLQQQGGNRDRNMSMDFSESNQEMNERMPERPMGGGMPGGQYRREMDMSPHEGISSGVSIWIKNVTLVRF